MFPVNTHVIVTYQATVKKRPTSPFLPNVYFKVVSSSASYGVMMFATAQLVRDKEYVCIKYHALHVIGPVQGILIATR
jgi:hypothetical protein